MVHELLRGMAVRLLFDEQRLPVEEAARLMSLSLSAAAAPASASAWIEGFLNQSALVLLHDDALWGVLAKWLDGLNDTHFTNILPMLRRTFSGFSAPERRQLGERAKRPAGKPMREQAETRWDAERAAPARPVAAGARSASRHSRHKRMEDVGFRMVLPQKAWNVTGHTIKTDSKANTLNG